MLLPQTLPAGQPGSPTPVLPSRTTTGTGASASAPVSPRSPRWLRRVRALPAPRPGPPPRSDRGRCPGQRLAPAASPHPRASGGFQRVPDSACSVRGVRAVCAASVCLGPVAVVLSHIHEPEVIITIFPNLKLMKSEMLNHKLILQEELTEEMPCYFSILLCQ